MRDIELKCWDRLAKLTWRPFEEARDYVHSMRLKSVNEWRAIRTGKLTGNKRIPGAIPSHPHLIYRAQGWISWGDSLTGDAGGLISKPT